MATPFNWGIISPGCIARKFTGKSDCIKGTRMNAAKKQKIEENYPFE